MKWYWRFLEFLPKAVRYQDWPKRRRFFGRYLPRAEPRFIPDDSWLHTSVIERMKRVPRYRPINLLPRYKVETLTGPTGEKP